MKVGTRPPLNSMVKVTMAVKTFRPAKSRTESGYASMTVRTMFTEVPTTVSTMEFQ